MSNRGSPRGPNQKVCDVEPYKTLLRLPRSLADRVKKLAGRDGVSINTWILMTLSERAANGRYFMTTGYIEEQLAKIDRVRGINDVIITPGSQQSGVPWRVRLSVGSPESDVPWGVQMSVDPEQPAGKGRTLSDAFEDLFDQAITPLEVSVDD